MTDSRVKSLDDLSRFRSSPDLDNGQVKTLKEELYLYMDEADWFTIGIMAPSSSLAISILREMEDIFNWPSLKIAVNPLQTGPVYLKANQKSGDIHVRIEYGLGEGILLCCQKNGDQKDSITLGPFPLGFFNSNSK